MRSLVARLAAAFVLVAVAAVHTQSVEEFDAWMRTIDEKTQSVQQHIASKDAAGAKADAKALDTAFELVEKFWEKRDGGTEAAALSREARQRAGAVERAIDDGDFGRASSESIRIAETCTACHRLHRPLP